MKTSYRPRDIGVPYTASRREHVPQLSISDQNHHVTEAIGDLYGDENYLKYNPRLLHPSIPTPKIETTEVKEPFLDPRSFSWTKSSEKENGNFLRHLKSSISSDSMKRNSFEANKISLSLSSNDDDLSTSQLSLNDMNYETDPAEFAQALSNLQALRRMSIDAGSTNDPDLPLFQGASSMPSIAPTGDDNSDDPSRLFWVPARVHPELAPMEFKTFLENRVLSIKRQTGEQTINLSDSLERNRSAGSSLSRKKSMLSRQINNSSSTGLSDKPEISENNISSLPKLNKLDLKEIDALVRNSSEAMRKLTLEKNRNESRSGDTNEIEDIPILPQAPGIGLRRSTRTTYRRGSLRTGQRGNFSKRAGTRKDDHLGEGASSPIEEGASASPSEQIVNEDFSQSTRGARRLQNLHQNSYEISSSLRLKVDDFVNRVETPTPDTGTYPSSFSNLSPNLPQKINTSLLESPSDSQSNTSPIERTIVPQVRDIPFEPEKYTDKVSTRNPTPYPGRSSSQSQNSTQKTPISSNIDLAFNKTLTNPNSHNSPASVNRQNVNGSPQNVPSLSVSIAETDTLIHLPSLEIKKSGKKSRKEKEDPENHGSRKTTWNWFKGGDEKEKREKRKDDDREGKKNKKQLEKIHDNARLDVLQSTLDTGITIGRDIVLLDRDDLDPRPTDEKKKESRKFSGDKKEKEGIFSSIFGGKKKTERDGFGKKVSSFRTISPEPHLRYLKPDVDYNWTRFSILEERAIYRMAHLKLANPRRALYSQVLLSNFMYSYLAKVQQMHPHLQIPQSALQKKLETERRQKDQEQQALQQTQESDQYRYDYHEGIAKYAEGGQLNDNKPERVSYVDDSQIYDFDHGQDDNSMFGQRSNRPLSRASQHTSESGYENETQYGRRGNEYYQHKDQLSSRDEDEMW